MIIFVIFSERGSGAWGLDWTWIWGLRSLEKECEEERVGMYLIYIYIRPCFPFFSFYSSSLWVEKQSINQSKPSPTNKQKKTYISIFIMKLSILAAWLSAVGTAQAFWVRPFYFTFP